MDPSFRTTKIRLLAALAVIGLHAAVVVGMLSRSAPATPIQMGEAVEVDLIDLGPSPVDSPSDEPETRSLQVPISEPPVLEEAEPPPPEPEVKPIIEPEPAPEPEPVIERQPEPEPELRQEPMAETPPPPEPKPEPKPKPPPTPAPKPKPEPRPKPAPTQPKSIPAKPAPATGGDAQAPTSSPHAASEAQSEAPAVQDADRDRPRLVGKVDYAGRRPRPEYPRASLRRHETGRVVVRVLISREGTVENVSVRSSSGHHRLDQAAVRAVKTAKFRPYTENGRPYPSLADIPFDFVL